MSSLGAYSMPRELKQLKKNFSQLPKGKIFQAIRVIRNNIDLKSDEKETAEFAETLFLLLEHFNKTDDYNKELFDKLSGGSFSDAKAQIQTNPMALGVYYGARFLGVCILGAAFVGG